MPSKDPADCPNCRLATRRAPGGRVPVNGGVIAVAGGVEVATGATGSGVPGAQAASGAARARQVARIGERMKRRRYHEREGPFCSGTGSGRLTTALAAHGG